MNNILSYLLLAAIGITILIFTSVFWSRRFNKILLLEENQTSRTIFLSAQMISIFVLILLSINENVFSFLNSLIVAKVDSFLVIKHFGLIVLLFSLNIIVSNFFAILSGKWVFQLGSSFEENLRLNKFHSIFIISIFYLCLVSINSFLIINPLLNQIIVVKSALVPVI